MLAVFAKNVLTQSKVAKFVITHQNAPSVKQEIIILKMESVSAARPSRTADYVQPITPAINASKTTSLKKAFANNVKISSINVCSAILRMNAQVAKLATSSMITIYVIDVVSLFLNV